MRVEVTCPCGARLVVDGGSLTPLRTVTEQVRPFNEEHTVCRIAAAVPPSSGGEASTEPGGDT